MKNRTKKIIAVVVAVLFSLTIIGGIILSAVTLEDNTVTASADTNDISPYSVTTPSKQYALMGCYQFTIPADNDYLYYDSNPSSTITVPCNLLISSSLCNGLKLFFRDGGLFQISANLLSDTGTTLTIIFRNGRFVLPEFSIWCFLGDYDDGIIRFVKSFGTPCLDEFGYQQMYDYAYDVGYESGWLTGNGEGYNDGENIGYNNGYSDGLNKGHSEQLTNPLTSFLEPVHKFMNTPFFGDLTYATIFNIILFVAVATIFIKMFSGG